MRLKFNDFVNKYNYAYYYYQPTERVVKGTNYKGYLYWLVNDGFTNEQLHNDFDKFDNVELLKGYKEYAPEITFKAIFIGERKKQLPKEIR